MLKFQIICSFLSMVLFLMLPVRVAKLRWIMLNLPTTYVPKFEIFMMPLTRNHLQSARTATVLMGTQLPPRTFECLMEDFNSRESNVDLMIIAGTSLTVQPAAGWVVGVPPGIITYTPNTSFQPHTVCTTDTLSIPSHPHPKKENDC